MMRRVIGMVMGAIGAAMVLVSAAHADCGGPAVGRFAHVVTLAEPGEVVRLRVSVRNVDLRTCEPTCYNLTTGYHVIDPSLRVGPTSIKDRDGLVVNPVCLRAGETQTLYFEVQVAGDADPGAINPVVDLQQTDLRYPAGHSSIEGAAICAGLTRRACRLRTY